MKKIILIITFLVIGFTVKSFATLIINGNQTECVGGLDNYILSNTLPGEVYTWTITPIVPPLGYTIMSPTNTQITVQWITANSTPGYTIQVTGNLGSSASLSVSVYFYPPPYITFSNEVGCQVELLNDFGTSYSILTDRHGCVNVCENSHITYYSHGQSTSTFTWTVSGGTFTLNGLTTITTTANNVDVDWGNTIGQGQVTLTENYLLGCQPKTVSTCINIIETPIADFTCDQTNLNGCWIICNGQVVTFSDLSTSVSDQIITWDWDFGDNTPHAFIPNPSHQYNNPGNYNVTLIITNKCGCTSSIFKCIEVDPEIGVKIECPNVVCENSINSYKVDQTCNSYVWNIIGGHLLSTSNNDQIAKVKWDQIGSTGFGTVTVTPSNCPYVNCYGPTTISVPVIQANGTIVGPTLTCTNYYNWYRLPAWPATNFKWTITNSGGCNATIQSYNENSHEIEIATQSSSGSFTLNCTYINTITDNACGGTASLNVVVTLKPEINPISKHCTNSSVSCTLSLNTVTGTTSWNVTDQNNNPLTTISTNNSNTVTLSGIFTTAGNYKIQASNPNFCDPDAIFVEVVNPPSPPSSINGETIVCLNTPYSYNINSTTGSLTGVIYNWTIIDGGTTTYQEGNSINYTWLSTGTKSISVTRKWDDITPPCASSPITLNITNSVISGIITGPNTFCGDGVGQYIANTNGIIGDVYEWSLNNNSAGSISSGQGTSTCHITWNHASSNVSCIVYCKVTKCGINTSLTSLSVSIIPVPSFTATPFTQTVCDGDPVTFTITSSPSGWPAPGDNYTIYFGDGPNSYISGICPSTSPPLTAIHTYTSNSNSNSTYTVMLIVGISGCSNLGTPNIVAKVNVKPKPIVKLSPSGNETACNPYSYTLTLATSLATPGGSLSYVWYGPGGIAPSTSSSFTPSTTSYPSGGAFYAVVTDGATGCSTTSDVFDVNIQPCPSGGSCTPLGTQYGITMTQPSISCNSDGTASTIVSSSVAGNQITSNNCSASYNINIWSSSWATPVGATAFGSSSQTLSPTYTFNKPGIYKIEESVNYANNTGPCSNTNICTQSNYVTVEIPIIPDFRMSLQCNTSMNGYILSLMDLTAVDYGHNIYSIDWYDNNLSTPISSPSFYNISAGNHTIILVITADIPGGYTCTRQQTINVPVYPQANFTITTQDPCSTTGAAYRSCEKMAVTFTDNSTPFSAFVDWYWDFGDLSRSHLQNTAKVYQYPPLSISTHSYDVTLIVTDLLGCTSISASKTITFVQNLMSYSYSTNMQYLPQTQQLCEGNSIQPISPVIQGQGNSCNSIYNFNYQWYTGNTAYGPLLSTSSLSGVTLSNVTTSGAYWVKITDAEGCILNVNPAPAIVSFINTPLAIITGKQDICVSSTSNIAILNLHGNSGIETGVTYQWNDISGICGTTQNLSLSKAPGIYSFTLSTTANGCTTVSAPYTVTVHALPQPLTISSSMLDCNLYKSEFSFIPNSLSAYTWSNGMNGTPIDVYAGGIYRVWETDQYSCRNYTDITIPIAPSTYFWRFPTGCYTFCPEDLPKEVDGPTNVNFNNWEWDRIFPNFFIVSSGINSYCQPFNIGLPPLLPDHTSNGDYNWTLGNSLCTQTSDIMSLTINDQCCHLDVSKDYATCIDNVLNIYDIGINVNYNNTSACNHPIYNISCFDINGNPLMTVQSAFLPNMNGISLLTFNLQTTANPIIVKVIILCDEDKCIGELTINLPPCGDKSLQQIPQNNSIIINNTAWLKIIPNPANTEVNFNYHFTDTQSGKIERNLRITDAVGREVIQQKITNIDGDYKLNVSQFGQGIYFVEILENKRHIKTERFVVHH